MGSTTIARMSASKRILNEPAWLLHLAGLPALTVPGGFVEEDGARLPIGMQLVGPAWSEAKLFQVARVLERAVPAEAPAL